MNKYCVGWGDQRMVADPIIHYPIILTPLSPLSPLSPHLSIYPIYAFTPFTLFTLFEDFKLIGNKKEDYEFLRRIAHFRNRVHIKNYFDNFEKDESRVFTELRTQKILNSIIKIIGYFGDNYSRPWK